MIRPSFTCPWCGAARHRPADAEDGYCSQCHRWAMDFAADHDLEETVQPL